MANQTDITGLDDLFKNLDQLNISEETRKQAIADAADIYGNALIANTPVSKKSKKNHLRDDVTYKPDQYPDKSVDVGFNKYGYYYRFVNNGTKNIHGKHFIEHTYDQVSGKMQQAMADRIRKG